MTTLTQIAISGEDWLSDRDKKSIAKSIAKRKTEAVACAKKLDVAVDALNAFMRACNDCDDGSAVRRADDERMLLVEKMSEYAGWLDSVYNK